MPIKNAGNTSTSAAIWVDTTEPTGLLPVIRPDVQMFLPPVIGYKQLSYILTFKWSTPVAGFDLTDIDPENCTINNLEGLGDTWTANVVLPANTQGNAKITVSANSVMGERGVTGPPEDRVLEFAYDTRIPTLAIVGYTGTRCERIIPVAQGSYESVMEAVGTIRNRVPYMYLLVQKGKYTNLYDKPDNPPDLVAAGINTEIQAGAELWKVNLNTCTYTLIKEYDNILTAARSLFIRDGKLFFFEGSHYAYYNEGPIRQIADPSIQSVIDMGQFKREDSSDDANDPGDWYLASDTTLRFVIDPDREDYQEIQDALTANNVLIIGASRLRILSTIIVQSADRINWTIRYERLNTIPFPIADDRAVKIPARPERLLAEFVLVDVTNVEEVYSTTRLRGVDSNWKYNIGRIMSVDLATDAITDHGINWVSADVSDDPNSDKMRPYYEDEQERYIDPFYGVHGGTASPMVWDGDSLNLVTGYGKLDNVVDNEDETARIKNWHQIQLRTTLSKKIPLLETNNRRVLEIMQDISVLTSTIFGVSFDKVFAKPREGIQSELSASLLTAALSGFSLDDASRFPESGMVLIDDEIISYADKNANPERLTRGEYNTTPDTHLADTRVIFLDHFIALDNDTLEQPIDSIQLESDLRHVYNQIRIQYGQDKEFFIEDADSVAKYGKREFSRSVILDDTQLVWVKLIAQQYLNQFKDIRTIVRLRLKPSLYLENADTIYLRCSERDKIDGAYQVTSLGHDIIRRQTNAVFRSI